MGEDYNSILQCSICLGSLKHARIVLKCGHTFCSKCLSEACYYSMRQSLFNTPAKCPTCRQSILDLPSYFLSDGYTHTQLKWLVRQLVVERFPKSKLAKKLSKGLKSSQKVEKTLESLVHCGVCHQSMDVPKLLPKCQHSVCSKCVRRAETPPSKSDSVAAIECPICEAVTNLPHNKSGIKHIDQLPTDQILREIIRLNHTQTTRL